MTYVKPEPGSRWTHPRLRGTWRIDSAGPKWILLRSETVLMHHGRWATQRVPAASWPGLWEVK